MYVEVSYPMRKCRDVSLQMMVDWSLPVPVINLGKIMARYTPQSHHPNKSTVLYTTLASSQSSHHLLGSFSWLPDHEPLGNVSQSHWLNLSISIHLYLEIYIYTYYLCICVCMPSVHVNTYVNTIEYICI